MKKDGGFSLIELIIVIAIMAVLVAIIAPNLTKYLGKSKKNTDIHNADDLASSIQTCIMDYEVNYGSLIGTGGAPMNLVWTGNSVNSGNTVLDALIDAQCTSDPTSKETGASATATIALRGTTAVDGYKVTVTIGNAVSVK